jgi:hypothetical protein
MFAGIQAECQVVVEGPMNFAGTLQPRYSNESLQGIVFTPRQTAEEAAPEAALEVSAPETAPAQSPYPPLTAGDDKPKAAAHLVRLENDTVELALQVLAPGRSIEAIRIDNLGGAASLWRSDGKDGGAPLSVSRGSNSLSSGAQAMSLALGDAETLFSLFLKDNGAFAGKATEFRLTVFFTGGARAMCALGIK